MSSIEEMAAAMKQYVDDPVPFVRNVLDVSPDDWQVDALRGLGSNARVSIRSGHGVGKTALEAWAVCWFLFTRPYPKIPCTAPTQQQLFDILWPEISKWLKRSPLLNDLFEWQKTKITNKCFPERWFATARTASKSENMAGFHEEHLLFICDEASGIDDSIYETIEGALTTEDAKLLLCGNPTKNSGVFKRSFFEDRELYYTAKVSCMDTHRVADQYSQRLIKQYGLDSDVVRVRVLGEFPKAEPDGLIPLELVEAAKKNSLNLACGHTFVLLMKGAFPINVLNAIKSIQEVCSIFCATANPLDVVVAETDLGRGTMGVIDGFVPKGAENDQQVEERRLLLRRFGYKL